MKKTIQIIISIFLFLFFAYYFYMQLDENKEQLKTLAHELPELIGYFIMSMVLFCVAIAIRSWRWNIMLNIKNSFWVSYRSISIGYLVQTPLSKLGEVVRITNQISYVDKSKGEIVSTVFVDRLLDFICLALILFTSIQLTGDKLATNFPEIAGLAPILAILVLAGTIGAIAFLFMRNYILSYMRKTKFLPEKFKEKLLSFLVNFIKGLECVKSPRVLVLFIISSVLIWTCYFFGFYLVVSYFSFTDGKLSTSDSIFVFVCSTLGAIIPVPGGLAYPLSIQKSFLFVLPTITEAQALGVGTVCYFIVMWVTNFINGGLTFLYQLVTKKKSKQK
jgi:glycosyltransferase 2 family protein